MAKRLGHAKPQAKSAPKEGADDLPIMHPERTLTIAGRTLTVREYGFREGMRLQRTCAPVVAALAAAAAAGNHDYDAIQGVLGDYEDEVIGLIAESCTPLAVTDDEKQTRPQRVAELAGVLNDDTTSDAQGHVLLLTWWAVNGGFFVRRATTNMAIELAKKIKAARAKSASAGGTSTSASSSTASPAPSKSAEISPSGS